MSSVEYPSFSMTLTDDGGTDGVLTGADSSGFIVGAIAWLLGASSSPLGQRCLISAVPSGTTVKVVFLPENVTDVKLRTGAVQYPTSKGSDASSYHSGATLTQWAQLAPQ